MNDNTAPTQATNPVAPTPVSGNPVNTIPSTTVDPTKATSSSQGKEFEAIKISKSEIVSDISKEPEIPEEVEKAGVASVSGVIELPPDVKKLGVTQTGASAPVVTTQPLPQVVLPISDKQIVVGLHEKVTNAFRWLSTWCIKKLKKAHIALKVIHGKLTRIQVK